MKSRMIIIIERKRKNKFNEYDKVNV